MSRTNSEEQLNFLLKCVKHSNNGKVRTSRLCLDPHQLPVQSISKSTAVYGNMLTPTQVDFVAVAAECGIVSKGAA